MTIRIAKPGFFTTVQDLGRYSYAHLGISPAGAADSLSFRLANLLVGNDENTPALEMTLLAATLEFEQAALVALTGARCDCQAGLDLAPANAAFHVSPGTILKCGNIVSGARCYLAVQGGFDIPLVMGSASTFVPGKFGGFHGRRLQRGDVLHVRKHEVSRRPRSLRPGALDSFAAPSALRVTTGPQRHWFGPEAIAQLSSSAYIVSEQSNRSGVRLKGEPIHPRQRSELLTEGVSLGAIQVPPDAHPIILSVDQQTTGGYPKIANVLAADMHRVGQLLPRDEVRFVEVSSAEAVAAIREQQRRLKDAFMS